MTDETIFRVLIGVCGFCTLGTSVYFRKRANRVGGRISRFRDGGHIVLLQVAFAFAGPGVFLVYLIEPAWIAWARLDLTAGPRWLGLAGAAMMAPAIAWMFHHLGNNLTPTSTVRQEHFLVTTGPYRFIRHPLYTFGAIFWLGLSLAMACWWTALFTAFAFAAMSGRTRKEEEALVERFGDRYRQYMQRTPRYLPSWRVFASG